MIPSRAAILAAIMAFPMAVLIPSVFLDIDIVESALKSIFTTNGADLNGIGRIFVFGGLVLLPVAFVTAISPMLRRGADGRRRIYVANLIIAVIVLALLSPVVNGIGEEIYRCEVLDVPNCD